MQSALRRTAAILLLSAASCSAQTASSQTAPSQAPMQPPATQQKAQPPAVQPETHITAAQAKELFRSVDEILDFASKDTGLPIRSKVKRRLTTRAVVEKYLDERMKDDKDARRMERSEIVLKKFGLIDRDFQLRPFLVSLLKEQIAGYYDSKTKTVNLLDWIDPESQKPVLAHELTHALQDQRVGLEKWGSQTDEKLSRNFAQDRAHIASDEDDTAREAVLEGQSMAVFIDYGLMPSGRSLLTNPEVIQSMTDDMVNDPSSPVLSRAPLLLQESLLFPYRDGLRFEAALLGDKGRAAAYAAPLDVPPSSSYEIINPRAYESRKHVPVLNMPDVHPLLDAGYEPGMTVPGVFDSLVAKLVVTGRDRRQALERARRALGEFEVAGMPTVLPFHRAVVSDPAFTAEPFTVHTRWIETEFATPLAPYAGPVGAPAPEASPAAARERVVVEVGGRRLEVVLPAGLASGLASGLAGGLGGRAGPGQAPPSRRGGGPRAGASTGSDALTSPMQGTIVKVAVEEGQQVEAGDLVVVLEAMKMEQPLAVHRAGTVTDLAAVVGGGVTSGQVLCRIVAAEDGTEPAVAPVP